MDTTDPIQHLSDRERDILALIAKGRTNADIGAALGLRFDTVKWYVSEILSKLAVDSREQAADAWRAYRRPQAVVSRRMRALVGLPVAKVGMGLAGTAAAGTLVVAAAGAGFEGGDNRGVQTTPTSTTFVQVITPNPDITFPTPSAPRRYELGDAEPVGPYVDIVSTSFEGKTYTFGMYEARFGLCQYWWDSDVGSPATGSHKMCGGPITHPLLLSMQGVASHGPAAGIVEAEMVRVRLRLHGGQYVEQDTVAAPRELDVPWRFWIYAGEKPVVGVEGLDAAGNVIRSRGSLAPLSDIVDP